MKIEYINEKIGKVKSQIKRECVQEGESIEEMIRRCTENNEPIDATAPMIYTEEAEGVLPQYDIRTDRTDLALDAIDKYQKSQIAKGVEAPKQQEATTEESAQAEAATSE